ncbi:MAG: hypothetical protein CMJ89_20700 [Planctomycetes bacterium]|nr:hypothetical protein [Planctomycetota bacterium]
MSEERSDETKRGRIASVAPRRTFVSLNDRRAAGSIVHRGADRERCATSPLAVIERLHVKVAPRPVLLSTD